MHGQEQKREVLERGTWTHARDTRALAAHLSRPWKVTSSTQNCICVTTHEERLKWPCAFPTCSSCLFRRTGMCSIAHALRDRACGPSGRGALHGCNVRGRGAGWVGGTPGRVCGFAACWPGAPAWPVRWIGRSSVRGWRGAPGGALGRGPRDSVGMLESGPAAGGVRAGIGEDRIRCRRGASLGGVGYGAGVGCRAGVLPRPGHGVFSDGIITG